MAGVLGGFTSSLFAYTDVTGTCDGFDDSSGFGSHICTHVGSSSHNFICRYLL